MYGFNRREIHARASHASGRVGILVKICVAKISEISVVDKEYDGILVMKLTHRETDTKFIILYKKFSMGTR